MHGNRFKKNDIYLNELKNKGLTVTPIEEYQGADVSIMHKCCLCGYEYMAKPHNILRNKSKCSNCKKLKIDKNFKEKVFKINPNIKILNMYSGKSGDRLEIQCVKCGNFWATCASSLYEKRECQFCGKIANTMPEDVFLSKVYSKNPNIKIVSKYKNAHSFYQCQCRNCEYIWNLGGSWLLKSSVKCPHCGPEIKSKGENMIEDILLKYKIEYIKQKTYPNLFGTRGGFLSYDFLLPQYNLLLEYQGIQHEKRVPDLQTEEDFKRQLEHDRLKKEYAKNNNIELMEIWYYDFSNIENLLIKKLELKSVETVIPA